MVDKEKVVLGSTWAVNVTFSYTEIYNEKGIYCFRFILSLKIVLFVTSAKSCDTVLMYYIKAFKPWKNWEKKKAALV